MFINMNEGHRQKCFAEGMPQTITMLEGLVRGLEEKRAEHGEDPGSSIRTAFRGLDLHPRIASVAADLFQDGHYRNAVLDASLALVNFVKEKSRKQDLDGTGLMLTVFSPKNPILAFNPLADQSDLDEQAGLMHMFEGMVLALRNPRAHDIVPDEPEIALEYIALMSLLSKRLDAATRR